MPIVTAEKIYKKYKASGILGLILIIIKRLDIFSYFIVFYFYRTSFNCLYTTTEMPSHLKTEIIFSCDDIYQLCTVCDKIDIHKKRLEKNRFAIILYSDGVPIGYSWGQVDSPHLEERYGFRIKFSPEDIYSFDSYIKPEYRRLGFRKFLLNSFIEASKSYSNKKNLTAIIEKTNLNSVRAHEKLGYRRRSLQVAFKIFSQDFQFTVRKYH